MPRKTVEKVNKPPKDLNGYLLFNHEKLDRVINGALGAEGKLFGGLGKNASPEAILAEYDKLGGLIKTRDGLKVTNGSFYDFENRKPKENPIVELAPVESRGGINTEEVGDEVEKPKRGRKPKIKEEESE